MTDEQNLTQTKNQASVKNVPVKPLSFWQEQYISFCATGGVITAEDGTVGRPTLDGSIDTTRTMKVKDFTDMAGVTRTTLFNWRHDIPDFWDLVAVRRKELGSQYRIQKVWNGLYLKAASGNPQAAALFLANFDDNFRMPTEKVEHEIGGSWAKLLEQKRKQVDNFIEGETTDDDTPLQSVQTSPQQSN